MRSILCLSTLGICLLSASPTKADWQNTTWEMSRDEVVRVTGAAPMEGDEGQSVAGADLRATGTYEALGFQFRSQFFFDRTDRLRMVKIVMDEVERCPELKRTMDGIYGNPVEDRRISSLWIDGRSGDQVRFTGPMPPIVNHCFVTYAPVAASGGRGL